MASYLKLYLPSALAFIAGAMLTLAFAPFYFWPFSFICTAILFYLWQNASYKQNTLYGFLFGFGFFICSASWIFISIHRYGEAPLLLALLLTGILLLFLSLFFALYGYLFSKYFCAIKPISFASLWLIFEYLRTLPLHGFPGNFLGESLVSSPFKGLIAIFSAWGCSWIICLLSASAVYLAKKQHWFRLTIMLIISAIIAFSSSFIPWTKQIAKSIRVNLVQGNIPQAIKWNYDWAFANIDRYKELTSWDADLIVWPENAIPLDQKQAASFLTMMDTQAKKHHSSLLIGIPYLIDHQYYNAALLSGIDKGLYLKRHLVPFGEYVPFETTLRGLIRFFDMPMSNFISGKDKQDLLSIHGHPIATLICYEIAYPHLVWPLFPQAELLITLSNDAWFGDSLAAHHHLQWARARSLETGRMQLFAANDGITAIISEKGDVVAQIPRFKTAVLAGNVNFHQGYTPAIYLGFLMLLVAFIFSGIAFCLNYNRNHA